MGPWCANVYKNILHCGDCSYVPFPLHCHLWSLHRTSCSVARPFDMVSRPWRALKGTFQRSTHPFRFTYRFRTPCMTRQRILTHNILPARSPTCLSPRRRPVLPDVRGVHDTPLQGGAHRDGQAVHSRSSLVGNRHGQRQRLGKQSTGWSWKPSPWLSNHIHLIAVEALLGSVQGMSSSTGHWQTEDGEEVGVGDDPTAFI